MNERIAYLVQKLRNRRKISYMELSEMTGIAEITLIELELKKEIPDIDKLDKIFKALDYKFIIGGRHG